MSTEAIIMMVCYLAVVWGGLGLTLSHLMANPDED
ncbi:Putative methionine and alanine importer, small subunit [Kytococcus aerolatus]|uniref:Putative methionine and alanine importer, small subunit n=1 Tax=Kytococcus aerolatus TaxID=592308 RepID=A0A212TZE9_9MICO|nr:methionine/alanine import family NSS transporter small subunit [Kytococcus aerolatus]SNC71373.1 Putative methionine and alanine importer, small subunit [Kytococcus aerolatus]